MYIKLPRRCSLLKCLLAIVLLCSCVPLYYSLFFLSSSPPTDYANAFVALDMESTKHEQFVPAIGESKGSLLNRVLESTLVTAESAPDKDATATKFSLKIASTRLDANNSEGPNLSLQDRTGRPSSEKLSRSKDIHDSTSPGIGDADRNHESNLKKLKYSLSDIDKRGEFQRLQMQQYCSRHPHLQTLPDEEHIREHTYKHLLYDDEKKIIFCYVPKVGCSNWKRMFIVLNGILPPTHSTLRPAENILFSVKKLFDLSPSEREWRLKNYYKYMMVRNPLERLVSAYLNKIHPPLDLKHKYTFPDRVKYFMLRYFEKKRYSDWYSSKMTQDISPSFSSYVQFLSYVYSQQGMHLNEHLALSTTLCQPCVFNYTFYANFKYLPKDATRVMDKFDIPHHYYRDVENHPVYTTEELVEFFFRDMSQEKRSQSLKDLESRVGRRIEGIPSTNLRQSLMQNLFTALEVEFDFYYSLYPEERNSHLRFLNF